MLGIGATDAEGAGPEMTAIEFKPLVDTLFLAEGPGGAIQAGIRWAIERSYSLGWKSVVCINVHPFSIEKPGPTGFISSHRGFPIFEWKYDTSPFNLKQLLAHHAMHNTLT